MQTRFFPASVASRFCLMGIVAALLMFSLPATVAFAQAVAIDDGDDVQYNGICQNIIGAIGDITQSQTGDANAAAADNSEAVAEVAQEQGVSIEQVNECLNGAAAGGTTDETPGGTTNETTEGTNGTATITGDREAEVLVETIPEQKVLANTGGPALVLLPALGLLLISSVALRNLLRR